MAEQLLTIRETAQRFGISRAMMYQTLPTLKAKGLQEVRIGRRRCIRESSVDKVIARLATREEHLEVPNGKGE